MLAFLLAVASGPQSDLKTSPMLCQSAIERRIGTKLNDVAIEHSAVARGRTVVTGRFTADQGMPPAGPGQASTHHLIRIDHSFTCSVRRGRVRKLTIRQA